MHDQLHLLVSLQDLDTLIKESEDPARKAELEGLGFSVDNLEPLRLAREGLVERINTRWLRVIGRQVDGVELADVRGELDSIASALRAEHDLHEASRFALGAESYSAASAAHLRPRIDLASATI